MDPKHFEEAHAYVLAIRKPLAPPVVQLPTPPTPSKPSSAMTDHQLSRLNSSLMRDSIVSKKRKAPNGSPFPLSKREIITEPIK